MKSIYGPITNIATGKSKDIIVDFISKKSFKDLLIGGGIITIGIAYIATTAFKNGANAFEEAEYKTLEELDLMRDC